MSTYKSFKFLLMQMDSIEGTTEGGRNFKLTFSHSTETFTTQIFSGTNDVFEPALRVGDVIKNNILSTINKIDDNFFARRQYLGRPTKTARKIISIEGKHEEKPFKIRVRVENGWMDGNMNYRNNNTQLEMSRLVPEHIHASQKHDWLYLHYQKPEVWLDVLQFNIKNKYTNCCGNNILGRFNYCYTCGKEQVINGLSISKIEGTELLNLLS